MVWTPFKHVKTLYEAVPDQWAELPKMRSQISNDTAAMQPLTLASSREFSLSDGRVGLMLEMERLKVPVVFPVEAIPMIQASLEQLLRLSKNAPKKSAPN